MIEVKYEKLMQEKGVTLSELPSRAKIGIKSIKQWLSAEHLAIKTGRRINPDIPEKVEANDEWVCNEINNYVNGKKSPATPLPNPGPTEAQLQAQKKAEEDAKLEEEKLRLEKEKSEQATGNEPPKEDSRATSIDNELKVLVNAGKTNLTLQDIKNSAPTSYNILLVSLTILS